MTGASGAPPYRFVVDVATADAVFEARGATLEALFTAAADATLKTMVQELETIEDRIRRSIRVEAAAPDLLLFHLLQELIYYKDAERLLLRVRKIRIFRAGAQYVLEAEAGGEQIDPQKHELLTDVKAVTLYRLRVGETAKGWEAYVVLDT